MAHDTWLYIDSQQKLQAWLTTVQQATVIGVDTESDSFHSYREKVCLIQVTAAGRDVIIDPLAVGDLSGLGLLFADGRRQKIFHDAGYDVIGLRRDFGFRFSHLFDTMLAARLLGEPHFGLAALLHKRFSFAADKRHQRSDWARRPLSEAQLDYARHDTHFLPTLAAQLEEELRAKQRWAWAREDFLRLGGLGPARQGRGGGAAAGFWRVSGARQLSPAVLGRLRALWQAREQLAERLDRPAFKVLGEPALLALASGPAVTHASQLRSVPGLPPAAIRRFGSELVAALAAATPVDEAAPANATRRRRSGRLLEPRARRCYEALRESRLQLGARLGLDPEVCMGNALLEDLARQPPPTLARLRQRGELRGWRGEAFAAALWRDCLSASAG